MDKSAVLDFATQPGGGGEVVPGGGGVLLLSRVPGLVVGEDDLISMLRGAVLDRALLWLRSA